MTALAGRLTSAEVDFLAQCEDTIQAGLYTFVEVGTALAAVRDNRLYRAEFESFEDYAAQRWQLSRPRAYELMTAAAVVSGMPDTDRPDNARQAVELSRVPEAQRAEVWAETVERTDGKPTAAAIRDTAASITPARRDTESTSPDPAVATPVEPAQPEEVALVGTAGATSSIDAWTGEERDLRKRIEAGETVVVSMRVHGNLIGWAESVGLYERVDRRTSWGNPFEMPADGDRATVIENYAEHYLPLKPSLLAKLDGLQGKALGCWCAPEACHGDVLAELAYEQ